jgi:flagellar biosynthesis/type III secretory pathway protein FliH
MRRTTMTLITAAALGLIALTPANGSAAPAATPMPPSEMIHTVQYWGAAPYRSDEDWERRRHWRERREQRDEARIAEAARREAWQIEQEREQRRAWRHAQREQQFGYTPGFQRGW